MHIPKHAIALTAALACLLPAATLAQSPDHAAVDRVMQTFLQSFETEDKALVSRVFRGDAVMIGQSQAPNATLRQRTGADYIDSFSGKRANDESERHRSYEIVDVADNLAAARVDLDYPGWRGVDYVVLLKTGDSWAIVSKTWTGVPKP